MPLRDHFRPPVDDYASWESIQGGWPMVIVQWLDPYLPDRYVALPRTHSGTEIEVDVATFDTEPLTVTTQPVGNGTGGTATATAVWAPPAPTLVLETAPFESDGFEVQVFDVRRRRRLVAAVELVSPANKDRPEARRQFTAKCAGFITQGVCVVVIDVVTTRSFNLYSDLFDHLGIDGPWPGAAPEMYAASCRWRPGDKKVVFESWHQPLRIGTPLPTLPLWLNETFAVPLELEASYEQMCRYLRIP